MKSMITRRLALIGVAVPMLLGFGVVVGESAAVAATAPDAHLSAASVRFITGDDNKDFNTLLRAQVETPAGRVASDFSDIGTEYPDNSTFGPFMMRTDTGVTAAMLSSGLVRIRIDPNGGIGHDTWHFSYRLILFFTDNTSYEIRGDFLSLSESNRELTTPFTLTTQVAVPNVVGSTEAAAKRAIRAAGLTVGRVSRQVDPGCGFVGRVMFQNPDGNTVVDPGTAVDITIGTAPPICS